MNLNGIKIKGCSNQTSNQLIERPGLTEDKIEEIRVTFIFPLLNYRTLRRNKLPDQIKVNNPTRQNQYNSIIYKQIYNNYCKKVIKTLNNYSFYLL